jgi:nucleoside 2-deoxyribosyltransferase
MKKIYFAAPLFSISERAYNLNCATVLEDEGYEVFLPQRDAGELGVNGYASDIYYKDITGLDGANAVVAVLNHRALDEGTVYEIGYAHAKGKPVIILCDSERYRTDNAMFCTCIFAHDIYGAVESLKRL